jgi:hypothetical protein
VNELERSILGTDDRDAVWRQLCPEAISCFAFEVNVGALFGLVVRGGDRVALKVHRTATAERLAAVQEVQEHVWRHGFPCPRPLGVRGRATLEEWREDGGRRNAHEPEIRRALAHDLVRLTRLTRELRPAVDLAPFLPRAGGPLWPDGLPVLEAPWIDEIARAARARRDAYRSANVIAHGDWCVRHFRFRDSKAAIVYGWDSVCEGPEAVIVGEASAGFTTEPWPTVDETVTFIADYERTRTSRFTKDEHQMAGAAAVYARAYAARRIHASGGDVGALTLDEYATQLLQ